MSSADQSSLAGFNPISIKILKSSAYFSLNTLAGTIGSVTIFPSDLRLRDSITLRKSAKYSSTGARFISSRQTKNGTFLSSYILAFTRNRMKSVTKYLFCTEERNPVISVASCQLGFTLINRQLPGEVSDVLRKPSQGQVAKARSFTSTLLPVPEKPPKIKNGFVFMADIQPYSSSIKSTSEHVGLTGSVFFEAERPSIASKNPRLSFLLSASSIISLQLGSNVICSFPST